MTAFTTLLASKRAALRGSAFALVAAFPSSALAQAAKQDPRAETLFRAAMDLQGDGQVAEACPLFAESKRLAPGVGVTLHLADCYERSGRAASAWRQFRDAERIAHERGDDRRANLAHVRAQALEAKLNRLTVEAGATAHDGWQLLLDGARLPADRWNVALALDPGDHTVTVQVPGQAPRTTRVHLESASPPAVVSADELAAIAPATAADPNVVPLARSTGAIASAGSAIPSASAASAAGPDAAEARKEPAPETSGGLSTRAAIGIGLAGLGAVGIGFGTFFLVRRNVFLNHDCSCDSSLENEATIAATVSFAVAGAALGSATALWIAGPRPKPQAGWMLAPQVVAGGGGAVLRVRF